MTAEDFLAAPTTSTKPSAEEFLAAPASSNAEAFLSSAIPAPKADLSGVQLTPYDRFVKESSLTGTRSPEQTGAADFLAAVGSDPKGFVKSLPASVGSVMAAPGKLAYYQAADAVSKLFNEPEYGGNIRALEQGKDVAPVETFVNRAAKTNPNLAVTAKLGQAAAEMAPSLGLAAAPAAVNRLLAAGFSAQMIASAPKLFQTYAEETSKPKDEQDAGKLADLKSAMLQTFVFAPLAGAGATHGLDTAAIDRFVPRGAGLEGSRGVPTVQTPEQAAPGSAGGSPAARNAALEAAAQMPERPETVSAQMDWLKQGKRNAVLLTPGEDMPPLPEGTEIHPTDAGTFVYSPERTTPEAIDKAVAENKVGDLLGYGIADKPAAADAVGVVTIRDAAGVEKQAVVTDQANLQMVMENAQKLAGAGDTVRMESPEQVLAGRATAPPVQPAETPTMRFAREQREAMAAMRTQPQPEPVPVPVPASGNAGPVPAPPISTGSDITTGLKPVEITPEDYRAARVGNNPFMEVPTATGLAKDIKRTQEFGSAALNERPGATEPQPVNQLFVGDQFQLKGQPVRVAGWVSDAETGHPAGVNVEGAYGRQFIPADVTIHIDKGTLTDPIARWFDKAIEATSVNHAQVMEGVTGAPVWMSKAAVNGALKIAKFAYTKTRDISRSVGEALRFLRSQKLSGYDEQEALNWLESNLRGDPIVQDTGRAIGAATEDRRPLLNASPRQVETGGNISTLPFQQDLQAAVTGDGWRQRTAGFIGGLAGETFPRTTRALRELGEQGARWISSHIAAVPLADAFTENVLRGLGLDGVEFGAALHEDNLRSIKKQLLLAWTEANAAGDTARAAKLDAQLKRVFTFVGEQGVFPDEGAYQRYLQDPRVQEAVRRHIQSWNELVEPMYKEAMRLDPSAELPPRGEQTGARINLNFVREGEPAGKNTFVANPSPRGQLSNVLQRRSPFGRIAKGTADAYAPSYEDAMRNTYGRQLEVANRNKFDRLMVASGDAIIDKPGKQAELRIKGERVTPFEIKRTVVQTDGQRIPSFENIYVRNSLAPEYRAALNLDPRFNIPVVTPLSKLVNGMALAGLTEISAHLGNQAHALLWRPGVTRNFWTEIAMAHFGRADALVSIMRALGKFTAADRVRLKELAEIGALREVPPEKSNWNPSKWGGKVIENMDVRTRLQMDRMYQNLADQGLVPKTETARREFVNQIGQYNRRAQGQVMHWLRDSGIAPFVTAGRAFNVLALKTAMLDPGIKTTSKASRLAVAATMISKVNGTLLLIGTLNYLLTHNKGGGVMGRPGVPLGAVDLGVDDKNRRPLTLDVANILGLKRVARVTGLRGAAESTRYNLPIGTTLDATYRDLQNAWTAPFLGPLARMASVAISGQAPAIGVPRVAPVVPPGQSQTLQNLKTAAIEASPIVAGIHDSQQPGATGWEWLQRQAGRFTLQPGKPAQMVAPGKYATIVGKAQASEYIDDVIMRARKMQGADRANYVRQSVMLLPPGDRLSALQTLEHRGIIPPGVIPR